MPTAGLRRFNVELGARVTIDGNRAELRDLRVGYLARVTTLTRSGGLLRTDRIEAFSKGAIPDAGPNGGPDRNLKTAPREVPRTFPERSIRSAPESNRKRGPETTGPVRR